MANRNLTPVRRAFDALVVVLPVIHYLDDAQAESEALVAFRAGAPGAFLIDHSGRNHLVVRALASVAERLDAEGFHRPWLGVNLLGLAPVDAFHLLHDQRALDVRGVWCDGASKAVVKHSTSDGVWASLYFGGVADFKGQPPTGNVERDVLEAAVAGVDVLTTSGPGTGEPCDPEKVRRVRAAAGDFLSVGVASGVTAANARGLVAAGADALLVATGIARGKSFFRMDAGLLAELLAEVRGAVGAAGQ